jgi:hypothetical protein
MKLAIKLILLFALSVTLFAKVKTSNDVYSYAIALKEKVEFLRKEKGIDKPIPSVPIQYNKYPRHVIQKSLEILSKINLYRIANGYGEIYIPPYPNRKVTPSDVYDSVKRLDEEVTPFIKNTKFLNSIKFKKYTSKTPNDVYRLLWSISLSFDNLLGIHGYSPTDVYALSEKLLKTVKFLRKSQNIYTKVEKPKKRAGLHPNNSLYESYNFLAKVSVAEKDLWVRATEVPKKPHRVITPTDVYDSLQYNLAELQRIKYRLGLERYFKQENAHSIKTPSDVTQNIEYATKLMPIFDFSRELIQYPTSTLNKTPNDVYAVTIEILEKLNRLKMIRGISKKPKNPPFIYGLKPIHTYQKGIEAIEKSIRLKSQNGFYPSQIPQSPLRKITPNEVYELALRLDGITTILLKNDGYKKAQEYIYKTKRDVYIDKTPSDVYHNLWKISNLLDVLLAKEYSPNETYRLAKHINNKIVVLLQRLGINTPKLKDNHFSNKTPQDVFEKVIKLFDYLKKIQKRLNFDTSNIIIPREKQITPNTVYNALRITNAALNEILIYLNIDNSKIKKIGSTKIINKTPSDVFNLVDKILQKTKLVFEEKSYDK